MVEALLAGGSILGGLAGAKASKDSAKEMADASKYAAQLQYQGMQEALAAQQNRYDAGNAAQTPYASAGLGALAASSAALGLPGPSVDSRDYQKDIAKEQARIDRMKSKQAEIKALLANKGGWNSGGYRMGGEYQGQHRDQLAARLDSLSTNIKKSKATIDSYNDRYRTQQNQQQTLDQVKNSPIASIFNFGNGQSGKAPLASENSGYTYDPATGQPSGPTAADGGPQPINMAEQFNFNFDESKLGQAQSYQFRRDQSLEALDRRLASSGMRGSGNRYAGILDMASGIASQEYEAEYGRQYTAARDSYTSKYDIYNLFAGMSGMGQVTTQNAANNGMQIGANMAGIIQGGYSGMASAGMEGAQANAAGKMGQNSAYQSTISDLIRLGGEAGWFK